MSETAVAIDSESNRAVVGGNVRAEFFLDAKINPRRSHEAGRPVYDMVEMVRIRTALEGGGWDRDNIVIHLADKQQQRRFPAEYARFKAEHSEADSTTGHPLKMWPPISVAKLRELAAIKIHTVEALAKAGSAYGDDIEKLARQANDWLALVKLMDTGEPKRRPGRPRKEAA